MSTNTSTAEGRDKSVHVRDEKDATNSNYAYEFDIIHILTIIRYNRRQMFPSIHTK